MRYSTLGRPRQVTDSAIASAVAWRETRLTMRQLAKELGVSVHSIRAAIARVERGVGPYTRGRPRAVEGAMLERVLEWHRSRATFPELAARLGTKPGTLSRALRCRDAFKQPSPERRAAVLAEERARRAACLW